VALSRPVLLNDLTRRTRIAGEVKSGSYGRSPGTREALGVSPGFVE